MVLSLVDEMYTLRRRLAALARAVGEAPAEVRSTVRTRCRTLLRFVDEERSGLSPWAPRHFMGTFGSSGESRNSYQDCTLIKSARIGSRLRRAAGPNCCNGSA